MSKRLRSSAEAVEVVQLASDPKTDRNASSQSDGNIKSQQEMSQTRDECPQRNWSSTRHI